MAPQLTDPLLPTGSTILVTAANGLIASHIVDQLLTYGYSVRGTVRSHARSSWMTPLYQSRHPSSSLEIVEIPDITTPGCFDAAMKGVSAVIHTAAINLLADDPTVIPNSVKSWLDVLESAERANKNGEKITRVVFTSSSWAVLYPTPNTRLTVDQHTFNDTSSKALDDPNTPKEARGLLTYIASKTIAEQEAWKWSKEHKDAGFVVNTVMPATCFGPVLAPEEQPYPSTAGFVRSLYENKNPDLFQWLGPQWFVDVRDAARLHVAAAVLDGVDGERVFAWAKPYTWPDVKKVVEKTTGKQVETVVPEKGQDLTEKPEQRSLELLKRLGVPGWVEFEESVGENIKSWYP